VAQTAPGLGILPEEAIRYYEDGREAGRLFKGIRLLERDPVALAMTPHLMAIGRKSHGSGDEEPRPPADREAGDDVPSKSAPG
jgi:hypothetical protein